MPSHLALTGTDSPTTLQRLNPIDRWSPYSFQMSSSAKC